MQQLRMSQTESQRTIQQLFHKTEELDSLTSPVEEDLPSGLDDEAESQPESESETDEMQYSNNTSTATSSSCEYLCCSDVSTPHHPLEVDNSKRRQSYCSKRRGKQKSHWRTIQSGWYKAHPWISVYTSKYRVYCATCQAANDQGLLISKPIKSPLFMMASRTGKKLLKSFANMNTVTYIRRPPES